MHKTGVLYEVELTDKVRGKRVVSVLAQDIGKAANVALQFVNAQSDFERWSVRSVTVVDNNAIVVED